MFQPDRNQASVMLLHLFYLTQQALKLEKFKNLKTQIKKQPQYICYRTINSRPELITNLIAW